MSKGIHSSLFWEKYDQFRNPSYKFGISNTAFQKYTISNPSGDVDAVSMLTSYELSLLYALAKDYYNGVGVIVDAGPLNGVCTNALAKGLTENSLLNRNKKRIYAFDLFQTTGLPHTMFDGYDVSTGSFLDLFISNNVDYLDLINIVAGDLLDFHWDKEKK